LINFGLVLYLGDVFFGLLLGLDAVVFTYGLRIADNFLVRGVNIVLKGKAFQVWWILDFDCRILLFLVHDAIRVPHGVELALDLLVGFNNVGFFVEIGSDYLALGVVFVGLGFIFGYDRGNNSGLFMNDLILLGSYLRWGVLEWLSNRGIGVLYLELLVQLSHQVLLHNDQPFIDFLGFLFNEVALLGWDLFLTELFNLLLLLDVWIFSNIADFWEGGVLRFREFIRTYDLRILQSFLELIPNQCV
jgi:hypothetical protein